MNPLPVESVPCSFTISGLFEAPRDLVWQAWTEGKRLMRWFGPKGFTMPAVRIDRGTEIRCKECLPACVGKAS